MIRDMANPQRCCGVAKGNPPFSRSSPHGILSLMCEWQDELLCCLKNGVVGNIINKIHRLDSDLWH